MKNKYFYQRTRRVMLLKNGDTRCKDAKRTRRCASLLFCLLLMAGIVGCVATPTPPPSIRLLEADRTFNDRLEPAGGGHDWQFIGRAGETIALEFDANDPAPLTLTLASPAGAVLATGEALRLQLSENGTYRVAIRLTALTAADYALRLRFIDRPTPFPPTATASRTLTPTNTRTPSATPTVTITPSLTLTPTVTVTPSVTPTLTPVYFPLGALVGRLSDGVPLQSEFLSAFDRHVYLFAGAAGQVITVTMDGVTAGVNPRMTLYDPAGGALATDDDSGGDQNARIRQVRLPASGDAILQVMGAAPGRYEIRLTTGSALATETPTPAVAQIGVDDMRLPPEIGIIGSIAPGGLFDRYFITADAGDIISISAQTEAGSPLQLALELYTPVGELMTRVVSDGTGGATINGIGLIETGAYAVFVTDAGDQGGGYTIVRRYDVRAQPPTPAPQSILDITDPLPAQTYLVYPFQGVTGERIRVQVEALSGDLDPVAALIDPSGAILAEGDDSAGTLNPLFEATLPGDGTYLLRVNAYGDSAGTARITVSKLP